MFLYLNAYFYRISTFNFVFYMIFLSECVMRDTQDVQKLMDRFDFSELICRYTRRILLEFSREKEYVLTYIFQ